jgi:hypothetical protein
MAIADYRPGPADNVWSPKPACASDTISIVKLRKPSSRWALWVFAAALLLKAAMPLLASASARLQGKALVEVCTVYGVSLVAPTGQEPARDHGVPHSSEHCALTALAAMAAPELPALDAVRRAPVQDVLLQTGKPSSRVRDTCAAWVARLRHGPPRIA